MMWVILGHCYLFSNIFLNVGKVTLSMEFHTCLIIVMGLIANLAEVREIPLQFAFQPVVNGFFSVDSFFFLR